MIDMVQSVAAHSCAPASIGDNVTMHVATSRAELHHVFRHASLRMRSNRHLHPGTKPVPALPPPTLHVTRPAHARSDRQLTLLGDAPAGVSCWFCWIVDAFQAVVHTIVTIATDVEAVISGVIQAVGVLVTGSGSFNNDWVIASFQQDFNIGFASGANGTVNCTSCGFEMGIDLVLDIDITSYQLQNLQAYIEGKASLWAYAFVGEMPLNVSIVNDRWTLTTFSLPDIDFSLGPVPVTITTTIPITAGWSLTAEAGVGLTAATNITGDVRFGIGFDPANSWQFIHNLTMVETGKLTSATGEVVITSTLWVMPTLVIQVDYVGGPSISLKAAAEATFFYDIDNRCATGPPITAAININLDSTIWANISINIFEQNLFSYAWPATTIFSKKYPIASGCLADLKETAPRNRLLALPRYPALVDTSSTSTTSSVDDDGNTFLKFNMMGAVWTGNQTRIGTDPSCTSSVPPYLDVFAQSIPDSNGDPQFMMTVSGLWLEGGYCVDQELYTVQSDGTAQIFVNPINEGNGQILFNRCASPYNDTHVFNGAVMNVSSDGRTLATGDACSLFVLHRR